MEKILLALDALEPDKNAIEFACYVTKLTKSKLSAVFLGDAGEPEGEEVIQKNISLFTEKCIGEETSCYVLNDKAIPPSQLIGLSRFSDMIIMDPEMSFEKLYEGSPTKFVSEILAKTECPVLLAPESFDGIDEVFFAYNDSASAVFAIKQFTYLFPQLSNRRATVVQANASGTWGDDKLALAAWLDCHYPDLHFLAFTGDAETMLFDRLLLKKNSLIVMGAYGRSAFSRFFKRSHADRIIKVITQPVFIAHS